MGAMPDKTVAMAVAEAVVLVAIVVRVVMVGRVVLLALVAAAEERQGVFPLA